MTVPLSCETSIVSLSETSLLWWTRGSMSILMPTSWYWNDVIGTTPVRADGLLRVDRRDGDRDAVADDELRLLALGDAQLRLGEELGVRVVLDEVERDGRDREHEVVDPERLDRVPRELTRRRPSSAARCPRPERRSP